MALHKWHMREVFQLNVFETESIMEIVAQKGRTVSHEYELHWNRMWGVDSSTSKYGPAAKCYKHGNEPSGSIQWRGGGRISMTRWKVISYSSKTQVYRTNSFRLIKDFLSAIITSSGNCGKWIKFAWVVLQGNWTEWRASANRVQALARVHSIETDVFVALLSSNSKMSKALLKIYDSLEWGTTHYPSKRYLFTLKHIPLFNFVISQFYWFFWHM